MNSTRFFHLFPSSVSLQFPVNDLNPQVQLSLGDFVAARRSLKKALQLGSQQLLDRETVKKNFKYGMDFSSRF